MQYFEFYNFEGDISARIEAQKEKAARIVAGECDLSESHYMLRAILSRRYNLPIFHEYFENRTFDELIFEIELFKLIEEGPQKRASDMLKTSEQEAASLFDDWAKEEQEPVVDEWVKPAAPSSEEAKKWEEDAKKFMETGSFK